MNEVKIDGKTYPARLTMGALREYAAATGNKNGDVHDVVEAGYFLWACVSASARVAGIQLPWDRDGMLDLMTPAEVMEAFNAMAPKEAAASKKKAPKS